MSKTATLRRPIDSSLNPRTLDGLLAKNFPGSSPQPGFKSIHNWICLLFKIPDGRYV